jgi:hypothetical protein
MESLGASYGMRSTRTQDPSSHWQSRPNGPMVGQGGVGMPGGMIPPPMKGGGGMGGVFQPGGGPRSGPIFQNPRPTKGGGMVGSLQPIKKM